jgi:hypothetical protein
MEGRYRLEHGQEGTRRTPDANSVKGKPGSFQDDTELSIEEQGQQWRQLYAGKIASIEREGRDPDWAPATEYAFQQDFLQLQKASGAELLNLECRTTGCLAKVQWTSYSDARKGWSSLLHATYSVNCNTTLDLPGPSEAPQGPLQAIIAFECEEARAGLLENGTFASQEPR